MFMLNGLRTKCFHAIVFKRISTPLSRMTIHTCDACNNNNNNMQQHVKLFYPF